MNKYILIMMLSVVSCVSKSGPPPEKASKKTSRAMVVQSDESHTPSLDTESNQGDSSLEKASSNSARAADLIITGRLERISSPPECGAIHFGGIAEYSHVKVIEGSYEKEKIYVVYGCPELTRGEYASGNGMLDAFRTGDFHSIKLSTSNDTQFPIDTIVPLELMSPMYPVYYNISVFRLANQ